MDRLCKTTSRMNLQRETRGANNRLTKHFRCINARRDKFIAKLHADADQFSASKEKGVAKLGCKQRGMYVRYLASLGICVHGPVNLSRCIVINYCYTAYKYRCLLSKDEERMKGWWTVFAKSKSVIVLRGNVPCAINGGWKVWEVRGEKFVLLTSWKNFLVWWMRSVWDTFEEISIYVSCYWILNFAESTII